MYSASIMCVHAYAYVCEHACVRVRNHSCTVIGILRNMQVYNYLLRNPKGRLHVHVLCNYTVCVHAYTYVRERACAYVNERAWVNVHCNYSELVHIVCVCTRTCA